MIIPGDPAGLTITFFIEEVPVAVDVIPGIGSVAAVSVDVLPLGVAIVINGGYPHTGGNARCLVIQWSDGSTMAVGMDMGWLAWTG